MSDEHGWPDFSHPEGHDDPGDQHDAGVPDEPADAADSPFHDDLFGHDDDPAGLHGDAHGFDDFDADADGGHEPQDAAGAGWDDDFEPGTGHDDADAHTVLDVTDGHGMGPVGADPDAAPDLEQVSLFPPVVDVGPLPEPVDGFPWIDTGSLGLYHAGPLDAAPAEPVPVQELADYAGEELAPGVDPWAALADSEDPATSALARWWHPQG
ncbi:hypothetical protein GCM10020358_84740 [Amorphoplanes nipponensis]|uniref:Uncharacterized protein n=1 Tax=Actinoplanes nipponensis TaxID=135950 RepID=A0A919JGE5_9ACTN|nr:hypothetical protein [Actinoplanes nipponensis]GIE48721.1 hypothetical protein Ani05nite_22550 [Actinoplanes nipponensis]